MTQEEKKLLTIAISGYYPYGLICKVGQYKRQILEVGDGCVTINDSTPSDKHFYLTSYGFDECTVKPYLRSLSSMTEEEKKELSKKYNWRIGNGQIQIRYHSQGCWDDETECPTEEYIILFDWLNKHHFDYRGLIDLNLAIKVTEKNNPYEKTFTV